MPVSYDRLNRVTLNKFGVSATYTPAGGVARNIHGIIDRDYFDETGGVGIQTETYLIQVVADDVSELAVGDMFLINGVNYKAVEIRPDFHGMVEIQMHRV